MEAVKETNEHRLYTDAGRFTRAQIRILQAEKETGPGKAMLARLRHAAGKQPEQAPDVWGVVLSDMSEDMTKVKKDKETHIPLLTPREKAVFAALTLYATAAQGEAGHNRQTQVDGRSLGTALGRMVKADPNKEESLRTKMKSLLLAASPEEAAQRLRPMIKYITEEEGLDFAMLAEDLYWCAFPKTRRSVHLSWARDFSIASKQKTEEKGE